MNEFTGGVLLAQLRKLDTIIGDVRRNARRVYDGIARSARARICGICPIRKASSAREFFWDSGPRKSASATRTR